MYLFATFNACFFFIFSLILCVLDRTRPDLVSEEQQKRFAHEMQILQNMEVLRQLEDFRSEKSY